MSNYDIQAHPAAALFPMMSDDELARLSADIKERGQIDPIILHQGLILDGRNRLKACEMADVEPNFSAWSGEGGSPAQFVASKNIHRRHLSKPQIDAIGAEMLPMLREEARQRQREHGGTAPGRPSETLGAKLPEVIEDEGKAVEIAARILNTGARSIQNAARIKEADPEAFERLKRGETRTHTEFRRLQNSGVLQKSEPKIAAEGTKRRAMLDNSAKDKLWKCIGTLTGICWAFDEINMELIRSSCSAEDMATAVKDISQAISKLRAVRQAIAGKQENQNAAA